MSRSSRPETLAIVAQLAASTRRKTPKLPGVVPTQVSLPPSVAL